MDAHRYTAMFEAPGGKPVLHAYPDPLTKGAPFTIGLGHCGPEVHADTVWKEEQCWHAFYNDYAMAQGNASHTVGIDCWSKLSEPRKAALTDMVFNMGATGLTHFPKMLAAIRASHWHDAHDECMDSDYADQLPKRADSNAMILLTGEWPDVG